MSAARRSISILLLACACTCKDWEVPPNVAFERMAAARHQLCVQGHECFYVDICHLESEQFCLDAGYPKTCGNMEQEGSCGTDVK